MPDIQVPHTASLQLQVRPTRAPEPIDQSLRFQLVFDALMKPKALEWCEMEFECLDEHSMPPPPQTILQQTPLDVSESQQGKSNGQDQVGQMPPIPTSCTCMYCIIFSWCECRSGNPREVRLIL